MIWRTRIFIAAIAVLFGLAGDASASFVIDFDTDSNGTVILPGTQISNQYIDWGVTFRGFEENILSPGPRAIGDAAGVPVGDKNAMWNVVGTDTSTDRLDIVEVLFSNAVSNISLMHNAGSRTTTFEAFLSNGSSSTFTTTANLTQPVSFMLSGIVRLEMRQDLDDSSFRIDDLSFDVAAVPEPSSMIMVAACAGAAGIGAVKRRRKRAKELKQAIFA